MRKLDLSNYEIDGLVDKKDEKDGIIDREPGRVPYDVRKSIIFIMFSPDQRLNALELLSRDKLANKINDCQEDFVLLEQAEYEKIKNAANIVQGYSQNDIELVKRIIDCPEVEVKPANEVE